MPAFFASDVHLRTDRPDRSARLARFVRRLDPANDRLTLVGDVCDFWFATRQCHAGRIDDEALASLARFRQEGGGLVIMPGNHDAGLGSYYTETLGADFQDVVERDVTESGVRIRLLHGHRVGSTSRWKQAMESRAFFNTFRALPGPAARALAGRLEKTNESTMEAVHKRHLGVYQKYARGLGPDFDLVVFGHVHETFDLDTERPRLVVLGDWKEQTSYLKVDDEGAHFIIEPDAL